MRTIRTLFSRLSYSMTNTWWHSERMQNVYDHTIHFTETTEICSTPHIVSDKECLFEWILFAVYIWEKPVPQPISVWVCFFLSPILRIKRKSKPRIGFFHLWTPVGISTPKRAQLPWITRNRWSAQLPFFSFVHFFTIHMHDSILSFWVHTHTHYIARFSLL